MARMECDKKKQHGYQGFKYRGESTESVEIPPCLAYLNLNLVTNSLLYVTTLLYTEFNGYQFHDPS